MINLSVIIPVYKVPPEYLRACLDSLEVQASQNCEFIVVSDGASDTECSICEEYATKDSRFKLFKREHAGVSATRNFGIEQAQGEYITFVDSDDWVDSNMCENTTAFAKQTECDVLIFSLNEHYPNRDLKTIRPFHQDKNYLEKQIVNTIIRNTIHIFSYNFIPTVNTVCKLYNRQFLLQNKIQYPQDLPIGEDRVFNYQVYTRAKKIAYQDTPFYHYRARSSSSRNSYNEQTLHHSVSYINRLRELSQELYSNEIALEAISEIWNFCSKGPREPKYINLIKQTIKSEDFQHLIQGIKKTTPHPLVKLDAFSFKRKWTFPIYIHLICAWTKNWFHSAF